MNITLTVTLDLTDDAHFEALQAIRRAVNGGQKPRWSPNELLAEKDIEAAIVADLKERSRSTTPAAAERPPVKQHVPVVCVLCDPPREFGTPQGLGAHKRYQHKTLSETERAARDAAEAERRRQRRAIQADQAVDSYRDRVVKHASATGLPPAVQGPPLPPQFPGPPIGEPAPRPAFDPDQARAGAAEAI